MDQVIASGDDEGKKGRLAVLILDWMWKMWNGLKKEEHTRHPAVSMC